MKKNVTLTLAAALAAGLIATGCGGNDDSSSDTGTQANTELTKAEFIAQADAICQESSDQIDAAGQSLGNSATQAQLEAFATDTVVPGIQSQIDDVSQLNPPAEDQETVDSILSAAQSALDEVKADPSKVTSDEVFADANQQAQDYGLKVCGN